MNNVTMLLNRVFYNYFHKISGSAAKYFTRN
jgi:hypothetical protein